MDVTSEPSNGARALTARHISVEQSFIDQNNAINATLLCYSHSLQPSFGSYLEALGPYAWVIWSCGLLILVALCVMYALTLRAAARFWRSSTTSLAIVLAVYPLVGGAGFITVVVPRARLLAEALGQQAVMISMYHIYHLVMAECGGIDQLVRRSNGSRLETRVLPCCCWPCCVLPRPQLKKQNLETLRYLVMQMPVIQAIIYIIVLILWAEDIMLYKNSFLYMQPFIAASILSGIWGVIMCIRAAEAVGQRPRPRFLALQLSLIIVKVQTGIAKTLPDIFNIPCIVPLHPSVFVNLVHNGVMIVEMLLLSIWAWSLYRAPPGKALDKVQHVVVAVLDDSARSLEIKSIKDGIDNKSFNNKGDQ